MNKEQLDEIKAGLKRRNITISDLAWTVGKSKSWLYAVLNGHYPYTYAGNQDNAVLPRDIATVLRTFGIDVPENM